MFDKKDKFIRNQIERDFRNLKMSTSDSVFDHVSKFETLHQQLVTNGRSIDEEDRAIILILSIEHISRFQSLCSTMRLQTTLSYTNVKDLLLEQESRESSKREMKTKDQESVSTATALINRQTNYNPKPFCHFCKKQGHIESRCFKKNGYSKHNIGNSNYKHTGNTQHIKNDNHNKLCRSEGIEPTPF